MIDEILIEKTKDIISDWTSKYPLNKEDLSDIERCSYKQGMSLGALLMADYIRDKNGDGNNDIFYLKPQNDKPKRPGFEKELENLINSYGVDSYVGLPDYSVAKIIMDYIDFTRFCVKKINER